MAYKLSDDDLRAARAAAAIRQANQAQQDYDTRLAAANQTAINAQAKNTGGLGSVLSGIGNAVYNTGKGLFDFFGSGTASVLDLGEGIATGKLGTREKDFKKWLYNTDSEKDARFKSGGTALEAASNIADLIPGVGLAKPAIDAAQGFASGVAQEYMDKGENADLGEALSKGGVSALASMGGGLIGGKIVDKASKGSGALSKALTSQVGQGAVRGGAAGGLGAGLETARQGGSFTDVLANTARGAEQGAAGGAAMAGTMGFIGKLGGRAKNKVLGVDDGQNVSKTASNTVDTDTLSNKQKAKLERQYTVNKQKQGDALLSQYGPLDKPARRAVGAPEEVLVTLYDEYGLKTPADVQYAANHVTGKDGLVSQMTRELAGNAKKVKTSIDQNWLDDMMNLNGLTDDEAKTITKQVTAALKRTSVDGYADGNTALDVVKQLEKQASRYKGKDGTYHNSTPSDQAKGAVLDLVRDELQGRIWDAAGDASRVLTPERIQQLKDAFPDNQKWADAVDNKIAKAQKGSELRSAMKPLVDGSKIVSNSKMSAGGFADKALKSATSRNPLIATFQTAANAALDSDLAKQTKANIYAKNAEKASAKLNGTDVGKGKVAGTVRKIADKAGKIIDAANTELPSGEWGTGNDMATIRKNAFGTIMEAPKLSALSAQGIKTGLSGAANAIANQRTLGNQIVRQSGLAQARNVDAEKELEKARKEALDAKNIYQNAMAQAQQNYAAASQPQNQGQQQLDYIANAMQQALAVGDISSYATLLDLYQQAYKIYGGGTAQTETTKLTDAQTKALNALGQLEALEQMSPDAGTAVANSPLGFLVDLTGGNDYANQAESLALTLGYLQSGANVSKAEAEAIRKSYIPTAFDSEAVRRDKLQRARELLNTYLSGTQYYQS